MQDPVLFTVKGTQPCQAALTVGNVINVLWRGEMH